MARRANLVFPFRGEQFSFSLNTKAAEDAATLVDMAAVAFDRQGQFLDVVHIHKQTALMGAICTNRDPSMWPEGCQAVPGDDVVHVMPKLLEPKAEVLVLVASVPQNPGIAQDLTSAVKMDLEITFASEDDNRALVNHVTVDLREDITRLAAEGKAQSVILGVVFLDQPGWTVRFDHTGSEQPSWSLMLPELQAAVVRVKTDGGVPLDSATALEHNPPVDTHVVGFSRQFEDRALTEATRARKPEAADVDKLRVDVGWKFWKKGPEEEIEGAGVEFVIKFYNAQGEEVQSAGTNEREAQGVTVGRPEPEETEETAAEEPAQAEEEEAEGEGEGGEEGGEPKEPPPPPPEPAEDPYEFKLRDVAFITLSELPKDVRSMVVYVTNYAGAGFTPLRHAGVKVLDVTGGEETATPLAEWHHISKFEQEANVTQVALVKVYKEYDDSAWNLWKASGAKSVAEFVSSDPQELIKTLKAKQDAHKAFKAMEAKALADAEESGEELTKELRTRVWRYSVPGLAMGGESLEAAEHDIKNNLLNYDGPLQSLQARSSPCARVQFGGEKTDTYFGGYEEDLKSGPGIYCFSTGALYVGQYKGGKREGQGVLLMPDGGEYTGEFAGDRFHGTGQYRYPDGSVYTGQWAKGKKHGEGVYWDVKKGCLRGTWSDGIVQGEATYDQPTINYTGQFVAGVPAGPGHFTIAAHRTLDMHKIAAAHILDNGPTLRGQVEYAIPPGSGEPAKLDEEGNPIEDPDKPPLPAYPKYEGLTFAATALPRSVADVAFPPEACLPVPVKQVPAFTVGNGLVEAS